MRKLGLIVVTTLALGACVGAAPSDASGPLINGPIDSSAKVWAELPTGSELAAAYPAPARENHMSGIAQLQCHVTKRGELTGCVVLSERPAGYRFAVAAFSLLKFFRLKPANYGPEATVIIPVRFNVYE